MSDCKRSSPTIIANGTSISKKRKITASQFQSSEMKHQLPNSLAEAAENILSSASDEFRSDHTPLLTCCSSGKVTETNDVKELDTTPLDPELKTKCFETVDKTNHNLKSFREAEIDEFFANFEREERKRFAEKYNFDIVRDMPLEGRYEWVRLH
ncbi:putative cyclin-dependent kinase inhibitor [Medicago truncatula]|uniref:Cyclin-dependent kinase inhibitor family protein n=2 Tax=Medicago truncatula TaxID=3880 RepID=G7JME7_MEDTR|nr:cyclin-dependent kinase inhibitor 7 [Medicago truncatula]AES90201.1 cyclin-dependent kinase inhibitor family protein [Medicago truncatula]RHN62223.1 putative cyclin-dependent kinase inhibitor [Medicago truncatula]